VITSPGPTTPSRAGQVALVTGGSAGLGYAIAAALATAGCDVVVSSRSRARCEQAADQLRSESGRRVRGMGCDVIDETAVQQAELNAQTSHVLRGTAAVAGRAVLFNRPGALVQPILVNGSAGAVVTVDEKPVSVMGFTVTAGKIIEIQILLDPERLTALDLSTPSAATLNREPVRLRHDQDQRVARSSCRPAVLCPVDVPRVGCAHSGSATRHRR